MHWLKKPLFLIWLFHKKLFKYGLMIIASFLILTLMLSAGFTGFLYYANKHGHLQTWLNQSLGSVHISYQTAKVSWRHCDPTLSLTGIEIADNTALNTPIKVNTASISFGIWTSILRRNIVADNISVSGLNFEVVQNLDGSFHLLGLKGPANNTEYTISPMLSKWFLAQGGIHLDNITANLTLRNGQNLTLNINNLDWSHTFDYYFNFNATISQIPESKIQFTANLVPGENLLNFGEWGVQFNGAFSGKDFTPLFAKQHFHHLAWVSGGGEFDFQGSYQNQTLQHLSIYASLNNLNLVHNTSKHILSSQIDEVITWEALKNGGWEVMIKPINETSVIPSQVDIRYTPSEKNLWSMNANDIDLILVGQWVEFWFQPTSYTAQLWGTLNPGGTINTLTVSANSNAGSIQLDGKDLTLGANPVFPKGWPPSNVNLDAAWQLGGANIASVTINKLLLHNQWLDAATSGSITVPAKTPKTPIFNLSGTFAGKNLEEVKDFYIPHEGVAPDLSEWLNQGLVKLPKVTGSFVLKGALKDLPYANGKGQFRITLQAQNASVSPWVKWPLISKINANVLFNNQQLTIDANQAETTGVPIQKVHFEIDDLRPKFIKDIVITGSATPTAEQGLAYLIAMPITNAKTDAWLNRQEISGALPVTLQVVIPIHEEHEPITATGTVVFKGNNWAFNQNEAPFFSNINGPLQFVNDEISTSGMTVTALNQPLAISIPEAPLDNLSVLIQNLSFLGQNFANLNINVDSRGEHTTLNVDHPLAKGSLYIQNADQEVVAHFNDFHLPILRGGSQTSATADTSTNAQNPPPSDTQPLLLGKTLGRAPALDITIDELDYGDNNVGQFYWHSIPLHHGIEIQHINLTSKNVGLTASAQIQTLKGQDHFQVQGVLNSSDYGDLLTALNYPSVMAGGSGDIHFNISFLGPIFKPDLTSLDGTLGFNLSSGKFLQVNTGIARIFGLVSLDTIFSTLSLNFQKMMSNGLAFDSVVGTYSINNGVATAEDDGIKMTGPSISMALKGQMNLATQTLNQKAVVMPQVGNSIAIAAAFVGGPIIGAATYFADKLLGNTIFKNVGLLTYQITGTFDNPKVTLFNSSSNS